MLQSCRRLSGVNLSGTAGDTSWAKKPSQGMWLSVSYAVRLLSDRLKPDSCSYRPSELPAKEHNRAVAVGGTRTLSPAAPPDDPSRGSGDLGEEQVRRQCQTRCLQVQIVQFFQSLGLL